ncbi:reverse transcriptase domain-containing protein [Tanacetum coccineum]|uniref:Reverse transcriptase domain-containing protein n=1 Tax=Tanacetum coccineum TaxID=301880 RepID=A0ABQ5HNQ4_9ASTR
MSPKRTTTPMTDAAIKALIAQDVATALAKYEANKGSGNGDDSHDSGTLKKMMTNKYCPRSEIKKLEIEIWNLKVKGTGVGSVMASKPKTMQDAIKIANDLMDQKIRTFAERQAENKKKLDNDNQAQQEPLKKQNVARAYYDGSSEKNEYAGTLSLCNKCKFHHNGPCTVKCVNCKRVGHLTRDCRSPAATNNQRTLTCYKYGNQGYYRSNCPQLKNRNHGNQDGGTEAHRMVYALGGGEADQDLDNMEDDINAYALFL